MPETLSDYLAPRVAARFPPNPNNPSDLGFNITHFANAIGDSARHVRKVFEDGDYPREKWLRNVCDVLDLDFAGLPPRPSRADERAEMRAEIADLKERMARLESVIRSRPERASDGGS